MKQLLEMDQSTISGSRVAASIVEGNKKKRVIILGAGVTGLSAARQLATHLPEEQIVLIEAERVGFGTSGRNSGFVLNSFFHGDEPLKNPELLLEK